MTEKQNIDIRKYARTSGICDKCLGLFGKPCIFISNSDEHLCKHVFISYKKNGGVK